MASLDAFNVRKKAIIEALAEPEQSYQDASPKGTVDEAIKPLIAKLNSLDGYVTTSSCAGRISVFLEGSQSSAVAGSVVSGGKGHGGRWLFVSHDPVTSPAPALSYRQLFCLSRPESGSTVRLVSDRPHRRRLVRFQFEPMILHIMTASLRHAQLVLSAAINAGFRESGLQSLKALDDPTSFPMVAVRTAGLAFETLVGYLSEQGEEADVDEKVTSLVDDAYLDMIVTIANERFKANTDRTARFQAELVRRITIPPAARRQDQETRRQEKRKAGLAAQENARAKAATQTSAPSTTPDWDLSTLHS